MADAKNTDKKWQDVLFMFILSSPLISLVGYRRRHSVPFLSNKKRFASLPCLILTREGLGEFETVIQTRGDVEGLHNCREFSQPLECLYEAMQTQEKSFLLLL